MERCGKFPQFRRRPTGLVENYVSDQNRPLPPYIRMNDAPPPAMVESALSLDLRLIGEGTAGACVDAAGGCIRDRGGAQQVGLLVEVDRLALGGSGFARGI